MPKPATPNTQFDYLLVGGGLQNAMIFLALRCKRPSARVALIEAGDRIGGNHTWCFHSQDVSPATHVFVSPLIEAHWPGYRIEFPDLSRRVASQYSCVSSDALNRVVQAESLRWPGTKLVLGARATEITASTVSLDDGRELTAQVVIDACGPERLRAAETLQLDQDTKSRSNGKLRRRYAYQKFVGIEMELETDAPLSEPVLMDARVPQIDGFRFVYVLPLSPRRVLIEDTYYSDGPTLDFSSLRAEILKYAALHGYRIKNILREESGVLPIPLGKLAEPSLEAPLAAGYAGGWFHPTTGYSFPIAARLAELVASHPPGAGFDAALRQAVKHQTSQSRFCLLLNRMLFGAFAPDQRRNVLERFYRLPEPTIARFYALDMTAADRARIICGRPPKGLSLKRVFTRGALA